MMCEREKSVWVGNKLLSISIKPEIITAEEKIFPNNDTTFYVTEYVIELRRRAKVIFTCTHTKTHIQKFVRKKDVKEFVNLITNKFLTVRNNTLEVKEVFFIIKFFVINSIFSKNSKY